jgi:hypothetical protein
MPDRVGMAATVITFLVTATAPTRVTGLLDLLVQPANGPSRRVKSHAAAARPPARFLSPPSLVYLFLAVQGLRNMSVACM